MLKQNLKYNISMNIKLITIQMVCRAGKNHEGRIWVTNIGKTLQKERQCAQHRVWHSCSSAIQSSHQILLGALKIIL